MSYCRFSSDSYRSDVYVYEADSGYVVHVAASRYVGAEPRPEVPPATVENIPECVRAINALREWVKTATLEPIGLEMDGASLGFDTPGETAQALCSLRELGYNVPQRAIDAMRDEHRERFQVEFDRKMRAALEHK